MLLKSLVIECARLVSSSSSPLCLKGRNITSVLVDLNIDVLDVREFFLQKEIKMGQGALLISNQ